MRKTQKMTTKIAIKTAKDYKKGYTIIIYSTRLDENKRTVVFNLLNVSKINNEETPLPSAGRRNGY